MWNINTLIIFLMIYSSQVMAHEHHVAQPPAAPKLQGESLYNLIGHWKNANGEEFPLSKLRGRPVVFTMAYTFCKASCPITVAKLKEIEAALAAESESRAAIVLASFDAKHDTPERLASYAKEKKLDMKRWILLSPRSDRDVRELAAAVGIVYSQDKDGEFSHSNVISLFNDEGVLQLQVNGLAASHDELVTRVVKAKSGH